MAGKQLCISINGGRDLVIDIGGHTTDWLAVNPGDEIDQSLARSIPHGIQSVLADFEESFRSNNLEAVKDTPVLPPDGVRKALVICVFEEGGKKYRCEQEVDEKLRQRKKLPGFTLENKRAEAFEECTRRLYNDPLDRFQVEKDFAVIQF